VFGKYAIVSDVKYNFKLEPDWYWMIRPPLAEDELQVSKLLATDKSRIEGDGTRVVQMPTTLEIAIREIAVTYGGTNIPTSENDPTPVLKKDTSWVEVEALLKKMPRALVLELWEAVGEAVPGWGPAKPKAKQVVGETSKN
jgi:hypothetical protein